MQLVDTQENALFHEKFSTWRKRVEWGRIMNENSNKKEGCSTNVPPSA